jgi:predicted NAD/FAD-dependent oxidoreductase
MAVASLSSSSVIEYAIKPVFKHIAFMSTIQSCLIVGAGISGLLAARRLSDSGIPVTVIEKSGGVGGRMATRRIGAGVADHGAQFITAHEARFSQLLLEWQRAGIVAPWSPGFPDTEGRYPVTGHTRFRGAKGMTSVPKHLSAGLDVRLNQRALRAERQDDAWRIVTDQNQSFAADALLLTSPVPQSLALLGESLAEVPETLLTELRDLRYHPTLCVLLSLESPSRIPSPGALHVVDETVAWIADNKQKGISPQATTVTIHATHRFSAAHFDSPEDFVVGAVTSAVQRYIDAPVVDAQLHRWRYAEPANISPTHAMLAVTNPPIVFAGDAFGGANVEGAALSGLAAADLLTELIRSAG